MDLLQVAEAIAPSDLLPAAYRNRPANVLVAAHLGARFGWDPATSCQLILVVDGKPTLTGAAMLGLIRQAGHSVTIAHGEGICTITGSRADTGDTLEASFTREEAAAAGLSKRRAWQQYEQDMLQWRAVSRLARGLFSDVLLGLRYVPDELTSSNDDMRTLEAVVVPPRMIEGEGLIPRAEIKDAALRAADGDVDVARSAIKLWERTHGALDEDGTTSAEADAIVGISTALHEDAVARAANEAPF